MVQATIEGLGCDQQWMVEGGGLMGDGEGGEGRGRVAAVSVPANRRALLLGPRKPWADCAHLLTARRAMPLGESLQGAGQRVLLAWVLALQADAACWGWDATNPQCGAILRRGTIPILTPLEDMIPLEATGALHKGKGGR